YRSIALVRQRSFTVTVRLDYRETDEGILVAHGHQAGGYVVYIETGVLRLFHHTFGRARELDGGPVPEGAQEIVLDVVAPGGNLWNLRLLIDGREVARGEGFRMLGVVSSRGGVDAGLDRRSPVNWELSERPALFPS